MRDRRKVFVTHRDGVAVRAGVEHDPGLRPQGGIDEHGLLVTLPEFRQILIRFLCCGNGRPLGPALRVQ